MHAVENTLGIDVALQHIDKKPQVSPYDRVFSVLYLKEPLKWNYLAGFGLMVGAVFIIFKEW